MISMDSTEVINRTLEETPHVQARQTTPTEMLDMMGIIGSYSSLQTH